MLYNYGVTAFRAIKQQKSHFILNVLGLGVGLASAILIAIFALYELSYDKQQPNYERVYRLAQNFESLGIYAPISNRNALNKTVKGLPIEDVFSLSSTQGKINLMIDGEYFSLENVKKSSPNILEWLNINVLEGDIHKSLTTPKHIALSEGQAYRLFGNLNIIGETLLIDNKPWTIGAVFSELSNNSHFSFSGLMPLPKISENYASNNSYSYIRLEPHANPDDVIAALQESYLTLIYKGEPIQDTITLSLQPLKDIHLKFDSRYEMKPSGSQSTVFICIGLSLLLIALASFNFINMSIAQSAKRAKEVGVRKAMGASRKQIALQFLTEYLLITLFALLIACALVEVALPYFNTWIDRPLELTYFSLVGPMLLTSALLTGVLAGAYPSWFMSAFSAKEVLNGNVSRGKVAINIRKTLLILQSALSIALIVGAMTLQAQLHFLNQLPVGYSKENRLQITGIKNSHLFYSRNNALMKQLQGIDGVKHVGIVDLSLTHTLNTAMGITTPNAHLSNSVHPMIGVGFEAIQNLGLSLIAGRDFDQRFSADWYNINQGKAKSGVIITESLVKLAGYDTPEDALGKVWTSESGDPSNDWQEIPFELTVVGVVKDIQVGSVRNSNSGLLFICGYTNANRGNILIKADMINLTQIKSEITRILQDSLNIYEPNIELIEQNYQAIYRDDQRTAQLVQVFSGLAVFLACMGIFGLASFSALRRQKEVAIRKVLGASRFKLVNLLAKEYLLLVAASIMIAFPTVYWLSNKWLTHFNERISQVWWAYGVAALLMLGITWLTVSTVAFRVSGVRPGLVLRRD